MKIVCRSFEVLTANILDLVVCDLLDVIETFSSRKLFKKVDFPTLVLPIIVTYPHFVIN